MNIVQRIQLHKFGYSKEEINALEESENNAAPEVVEGIPVDSQSDNTDYSDRFNAIETAINNLVSEVQKKNIRNDPAPVQDTPSIDDVLKNLMK